MKLLYLNRKLAICGTSCRQSRVSISQLSFRDHTSIIKWEKNEVKLTQDRSPGKYVMFKILVFFKKFEHWRVTEIIKKTFEEHLMGENYDHEVCHHMT